MRFPLAIGALFAFDLLLALALPSREAGAGTAQRLDLAGLVRGSELIVEGRVLSTRCLEADGLLVTECLLEVSRTLKGEDEPLRTLRLLGGVREDGSGLVVPGVPGLRAGEDLLLFLGPEGRAGLRMPTGLAQGRFRLRTELDGSKRLERDTSSLALVGERREEAGGRDVLDYADVLAAVAAAAGSTGAGR